MTATRITSIARHEAAAWCVLDALSCPASVHLLGERPRAASTLHVTIALGDVAALCDLARREVFRPRVHSKTGDDHAPSARSSSRPSRRRPRRADPAAVADRLMAFLRTQRVASQRGA